MLHKSDASDLSRFSKIRTYIDICVYVYLTASGDVSVVGVGDGEGRTGDSSESVHCALV